jgi:hypothetical protein
MGATWAQVEAAAPELAARARAVVERHGLLLLGTLRADGAPRISPVEAHLVGGDIALPLIPGSRKARDLARDPRLALQSPVTDAGDPGEELKAHGRAVPVTDEAGRRAIADAVAAAGGWRPAASWLLVTVELESLAHVEWIAGEMVLRQWTAATGARPAERRRLDMEAGAYVPSPEGSLRHMSEHPEDEVREEERRVAEEDPHERAPAGEDEAGDEASGDPGGQERTDDDLPPGLGRLDR